MVLKLLELCLHYKDDNWDPLLYRTRNGEEGGGGDPLRGVVWCVRSVKYRTREEE